MYERSASILERCFDKIFSQADKSLKEYYQEYLELIQKIENYQKVLEKEENIIKDFEEVANQIQEIQKKQEKLTKANIDLEEKRNNLFNELEDNTKDIENRFEKIENKVSENNEQLEELRTSFIEYLKDFTDRQKERNKISKERRAIENEYLEFIKMANEKIENTDINIINRIKKFIISDTEKMKSELAKVMIDNGKNEKVSFSEEVIKKAIDLRCEIAKKEAECYIISFERTRKILEEIEKENFKINRYKKTLRDISVKLSFLRAEKEYIVGFLDNERMAAINGPKIHKNMMAEACKNFEKDKEQINNLYELILREISSKATKKVYKELYDKTYLKNIEENEKVFQKEVDSIDISLGTFINSNYW